MHISVMLMVTFSFFLKLEYMINFCHNIAKEKYIGGYNCNESESKMKDH